MPCALCKLERKTFRYYEDDLCTVVDCLTCGTPLIVIKRHTVTLTELERVHMELVVEHLKMKVIRREPRKIKDHIHWHLAFQETAYAFDNEEEER